MVCLHALVESINLETCADPESALERLEGGSACYDLVISDERMLMPM